MQIDIDDNFDKFFKEIERDVDYLTAHKIEVGYDESLQHSSGNPTHKIAEWNNNGVKDGEGGWRIPPRPFFDVAVSLIHSDLDKYNTMVRKALHHANTGNTGRIYTAFKMIGDKASDEIRFSIDTQDFTPLAPSTIAKKGSDVILIETNDLYDQAGYVIKRGVD